MHQVEEFGIEILPVTHQCVRQATALAAEHGLLTNDALCRLMYSRTAERFLCPPSCRTIEQPYGRTAERSLSPSYGE